jgi:uncharacterized protein YyaL (SSP411 family)
VAGRAPAGNRKDGRAHLDAYLDDHAFLLAALLELMQADFRGGDLAFAIELADALLLRFEDPEAGGRLLTRSFTATTTRHQPATA